MTANSRRGMTLVELMVSVSVLSVVMTAVISSFLTTQRMLKDAMGLSELSLAAREIREKILFNATPHSSSTRYAGLLSSKPSGTSMSPISSAGKITMSACTLGSSLDSMSSSPAEVEIGLATSSDGKKHYLFNNKSSSSTRWFWPIGTSILSSSMSEIVSYDTATLVDSINYSSAQNAVRVNIDLVVTSDAKNPDGTPMVRRERIVVPIFGVVQPSKIVYGGKEYY